MQHSNSYIIAFAAAVCAVCGLFVSFSAVSLKSLQQENVLLDRQRNVLAVAGLIEPGRNPGKAELSEIFESSVRPRVIDLATGENAPETDPALFDQRKAAKDPDLSSPAPPNPSKIMRLPNQALVYEVIRDGEYVSLILPIQGMGLWSVLYGYLALDSDGTTVRGITYYEHGETPGLGGEVDNPRWKAMWVGRKAFDDRGNVKIRVIKGSAGPAATHPYDVDGLSGATITSRGVSNMVRFWLGENGFGPFLERYRAQRVAAGS